VVAASVLAQVTMVPVNSSGGRATARWEVSWLMSLGDDADVVCTYGPMDAPAVTADAAGEGESEQPPKPLPDGVAEVEADAQFASVRVVGVLLSTGASLQRRVCHVAPLKL
jgi:hypothetical protein